MAKPKLCLIPSAIGDKLYSVLPSDGSGDFDFTRATTATRVNKDGLIETVASGDARLNYPMIDGKVSGCPSHLLEPQRLQLIQYSEDFSNAAWNKSSTGINTSVGTNGINPNVAISPDGTQNADRVNFNLQSDLDAGMFDIFAASQNNTYSASVYLKGEGSNIGKRISIRVKRFSGGTFTSVDTKYTLTDKWVRLEIDPLTMPSGSTNGIISFTSSQATNCLIYGCQVEQGSYPTSYIPNYGTGAGVTRSAETANGAGDADTFNDSEGVLYFEGSLINDNGTSNNITLGDNTSSNNRMMLLFSNGIANRISARFDSLGSDVTLNADNYDLTLNHKVVLKYKSNDIAIWVDGFKIQSGDFSFSAPTLLNRIDFYNPFGGGQNNFYGNTKQIQYFDTALTDTDLEELTSWTSFNEMATSQLYSIQ